MLTYGLAGLQLMGIEGRLTLDPQLMEAAGIIPYEKVQVVNVSNGSRLETYVIPGRPGSGNVILNGAAARWGEIGDPVIILAYAHVEEAELAGFRPRIVFVDERNHVVSTSAVKTA